MVAIAERTISEPAQARPSKTRTRPLSPPSIIERVQFFSPTASQELRQFLSVLFPPTERIWFYPLMRKEIAECRKDDPDFPQRIFGNWSVIERPDDNHMEFDERDLPVLHHWPRTALPPISTTLASRRFDQAVQKLAKLNALGYEIFICPNHLSCGKRCQRTVKTIRVLVLEGDDDDKRLWMDFIKKYKESILAVVDTGRRSLHVHIHIFPTIPNPHCIYGWKHLRRLLDDDPIPVRLPAHQRITDHWMTIATAAGLCPDRKVLHNFAGLVRCPGFIHPLTGRMSQLIRIDTLPDRMIVPMNVVSLPSSSIVSQCSCDCGAPVVDVRGCGDVIKGTGTTMLSGDKEGCTKTTANPTFLDDLNIYLELRTKGIPRRGTRREMHRPFFTAARLFGWFGNEKRAGEEWRRIVAINASAIGCSVNEAVQDLMRDRRAIRLTGFHLPDVRALPNLDRTRMICAKRRCEDFGCSDPTSAAQVIAQVLYPAIRRCPPACVRGTIAIRSTEMQNACPNKRYLPTREWLFSTNIMAMTHPDYHPGVRSRLYRVNIPLVLWFLDFGNDELRWNWTNVGRQKDERAYEESILQPEPNHEMAYSC